MPEKWRDVFPMIGSVAECITVFKVSYIVTVTLKMSSSQLGCRNGHVGRQQQYFRSALTLTLTCALYFSRILVSHYTTLNEITN